MIVGRKLKGERKMCLTFREHELYTLVLCGNDNPQICAKMDLTIGTVRTMLQTVYKHLGYKNKNDLLVGHLDKALVQEQINTMMSQQDDVHENFG